MEYKEEKEGIEKFNFESESLAVDKLRNELLTTYQNDVNVLKINEHVEALSKANDNFKKLFDNRSIKTTVEKHYDTKAIRKNIFSDYRKLVNYIVSVVDIDEEPESDYTKVLQAINNGRSYYANILARHNGNKNDNG